MFKNPGSTIRSIAITLFGIVAAIFIIVSFILSFFVWPEIYESFIGFSDETEIFIKIVSFIVTPIIPVLVLYILTLFLVSFGELVQNSTEIKEMMENSIKPNNTFNPVVETNSAITIPVNNAEEVIEHPYTEDDIQE